EFFAPEAGRDIVRPEAVTQELAGGLEDLVTGLVTLRVVVVLEIVEVEQEHGEGMMASPRVDQYVGEFFQEEALVVELGQTVAVGHLLRSGAQVVVVEGDAGQVGDQTENGLLVLVMPGDSADADDAPHLVL